MSVDLGVNSGFVTVEPTDDPASLYDSTIDDSAAVTKHTVPVGYTKIIKVGWYCGTATEESNFEIGLYDDDGAVVPGEAGTLLYSSATNAKGTTAGWKTVNVDWDVTPGESYWLGVQVDDTATITKIDGNISGGAGYDIISTGQTTLPNPFGGGAFTSGRMHAIWALVANKFWKTVSGSGFINIGDSWKTISGTGVINIGDSWKTISGSWKIVK